MVHASHPALHLHAWCDTVDFLQGRIRSRLPGQLRAVDGTLGRDGATTFVCLNDDIKESTQGTERLNGILQGGLRALVGEVAWGDRVAFPDIIVPEIV